MDLQPTDLQELLRSNAEDVLAREAPADRVREMEQAGEPDAALWSTLVELGWTRLAVPEEHGGQGGSLLDLAVIIEQLCRFAVLTPFVPTTLAALAVQRHGDEALQAELLPRIAEGATVSIALAEGRGKMHDLAATVEDGAVHGEKHFVEYARSSDLHLVAASRNGAPGLAVVAAGADGVRIERDLASIGKTPQAVVVYEGAQADAWIEGEAAAVEDLRRLGSTLASLESYAHAQRALDMTVDYVQTRVQFGRPIGSFQAVQMRLADLATRVQASNFLVHELLWHFGEGSEDPSQVAVVKAVTAATVAQVTQDCHLLHGGIGFMQGPAPGRMGEPSGESEVAPPTEYPLYFHTIRGKEASLRFGGAGEALRTVASALLD